MKSITEFVNHRSSLTPTKVVKTTLFKYLVWRFKLNNINELTFEKFEDEIFDDISLENDFNDDIKVQYEFLMREDVPIELSQTRTKWGPIEVTFTIDDIVFHSEQNGWFE